MSLIRFLLGHCLGASPRPCTSVEQAGQEAGHVLGPGVLQLQPNAPTGQTAHNDAVWPRSPGAGAGADASGPTCASASNGIAQASPTQTAAQTGCNVLRARRDTAAEAQYVANGLCSDTGPLDVLAQLRVFRDVSHIAQVLESASEPLLLVATKPAQGHTQHGVMAGESAWSTTGLSLVWCNSAAQALLCFPPHALDIAASSSNCTAQLGQHGIAPHPGAAPAQLPCAHDADEDRRALELRLQTCLDLDPALRNQLQSVLRLMLVGNMATQEADRLQDMEPLAAAALLGHEPGRESSAGAAPSSGSLAPWAVRWTAVMLGCAGTDGVGVGALQGASAAAAGADAATVGLPVPAVVLQLLPPPHVLGAGSPGASAVLSRERLMLRSVPSIVTLCRLDGSVLHQNPASVEYMGARAPQQAECGCAAPCARSDGSAAPPSAAVAALQAASPLHCCAALGAGTACGQAPPPHAQPQQGGCPDVLSQLFALEPEKRVDMLETLALGGAVCRQGQGCHGMGAVGAGASAAWEGLVQVPQRLMHHISRPQPPQQQQQDQRSAAQGPLASSSREHSRSPSCDAQATGGARWQQGSAPTLSPFANAASSYTAADAALGAAADPHIGSRDAGSGGLPAFRPLRPTPRRASSVRVLIAAVEADATQRQASLQQQQSGPNSMITTTGAIGQDGLISSSLSPRSSMSTLMMMQQRSMPGMSDALGLSGFADLLTPQTTSLQAGQADDEQSLFNSWTNPNMMVMYDDDNVHGSQEDAFMAEDGGGEPTFGTVPPPVPRQSCRQQQQQQQGGASSSAGCGPNSAACAASSAGGSSSAAMLAVVPVAAEEALLPWIGSCPPFQQQQEHQQQRAPSRVAPRRSRSLLALSAGLPPGIDWDKAPPVAAAAADEPPSPPQPRLSCASSQQAPLAPLQPCALSQAASALLQPSSHSSWMHQLVDSRCSQGGSSALHTPRPRCSSSGVFMRTSTTWMQMSMSDEQQHYGGGVAAVSPSTSVKGSSAAPAVAAAADAPASPPLLQLRSASLDSAVGDLTFGTMVPALLPQAAPTPATAGGPTPAVADGGSVPPASVAATAAAADTDAGASDPWVAPELELMPAGLSAMLGQGVACRQTNSGRSAAEDFFDDDHEDGGSQSALLLLCTALESSGSPSSGTGALPRGRMSLVPDRLLAAPAAQLPAAAAAPDCSAWLASAGGSQPGDEAAAAAGQPGHGGDGNGGSGGDGELCWHEIRATRLADPLIGEDLLLLVQTDVTARVLIERQLAATLQVEYQLLEGLYPAHVLQQAEAAAAAAAVAAAPAAPVPAGTATQAHSSSGAERPPALPFGLGMQPVLSQLRGNGGQLAAKHGAVTILFADVADFASLCAEADAEAAVAFLSDLFGRFDELLDGFPEVHKVETTGDCYMVAGGLMQCDSAGATEAAALVEEGLAVEHSAVKVVSFAKAMLREAAALKLPTGQPVRLRVGLHSGPATSGLVGTRMPRFCLFGDTLETASRMATTSAVGCAHASAATRDLVQGEAWRDGGVVEIKGGAQFTTYLLRPGDLAL